MALSSCLTICMWCEKWCQKWKINAQCQFPFYRKDLKKYLAVLPYFQVNEQER